MPFSRPLPPSLSPLQVRECVRMVDVLAKQRGLAFMCAIDSAVPRVVALDSAYLRQLLLNLLFNALQHTARWGGRGV